MGGEELKELERTYRKLLSAGLLLLLVGFGLIIFKPPLGWTASMILGAIIFAVSFIPLELARRTARRMAVIAFRGE